MNRPYYPVNRPYYNVGTIGYGFTIKDQPIYHTNQYRNMNGLISLISLSALLLAVSGQFPTLSPDYSLQGTISIVDGNEVSTGPYSVSVDIVRSMRLVVETLTVTGGGPVLNNIRLYSDDDGAAYISVNNFCTQYSLDEDAIFPIDTNVWDLYANGTELSPGTYTFIQDSITHTVMIINGVPGVFTFTNGNTVTTITVTNFDDAIPDFSTFCLPSQCSGFTCNFCYSSAVSVSISIMLLLTTLLVYLFTTL